MMRKRRLVIGAPEVFVNVRRSSIVPNVALPAGLDVISRTALGPALSALQSSSRAVVKVLPAPTGAARLAGPEAPNRWPAPAEVPLVSTKMKSAALLLVSSGAPGEEHEPLVVMEPCLPQRSRAKA